MTWRVRLPLFLSMATLAVVLPFVDTLAQQPKKGRKVALLVAVQDYSDTGLTNLKHCENDIDELAAVLKAQGYADEDVIVLTDSTAAAKKKLKYMPTADNVRKELKGLVEDLREEDTFLVAFSGHGAHLKALKERGLHFCAKATNLEDAKTMVSLAEVYEQLEKHCRAELKLLFVDACRNDPTDGKAGDGRLESLTRPLIPDPPGGTVAFFSCSTGQKSYESDKLKHGVFFYHVIQGLKGGPKDDPIARAGRVTVPLLEDYLSRAVPLAVKKDRDDRNLRQIPERMGKLRGEGVLALVDISPIAPPPMPKMPLPKNAPPVAKMPLPKTAPPVPKPAPPVGTGNSVVVMDTNHGPIEIELFTDKAPVTVKNFLGYVADKHYDGTIFHRVIEDFMIQGGGYEPGMKLKKTREPIKNESDNGLSNERGTVVMARTSEPNSATAQFFINTVDNMKFLDRATARDNVGYCVFGKVTKGMDVVDKIRKVKTGDTDGHQNVPTEDVVIKSVTLK